jgi:predicted Zn-dependent protease with MMP-like domain
VILRALTALLVLVVSTGAALADRKADIDELVELMQFAGTIEIIRDEGQGYGEIIAEDMLSGISAESWNATVADIYDTQWMLGLVRQGFDTELSQTDLAPLLKYYRSDAGREVIRLEITARRAFSDTDVEEAAKLRLDMLIEEQAYLYKQVQILINDSNLIDLNVAGTLNSSLMFYTGLYEGLDLQASAGVSEGEMIADVWAQEEETRAESALWLNSYMVMAYQPLPPDALEAYAAFFRSNEGRDLNRAIFAGFDRMFEQISYKLGLAVASYMSSEPL